MELYHVMELIGEGSFGRVYKGRLKHSKKVLNKCITLRVLSLGCGPQVYSKGRTLRGRAD